MMLLHHKIYLLIQNLDLAKLMTKYFGNLCVFMQADSPQVKPNFISSIINFLCELPHELPNDIGKF